MGNMSRKGSGEVPTCDAQPLAVPGSLIREISNPVSVLGSIPAPRTYRPSTRVTGVLRLYATGMEPYVNILGDYLPLRTHLPTQRGGCHKESSKTGNWNSTLFLD